MKSIFCSLLALLAILASMPSNSKAMNAQSTLLNLSTGYLVARSLTVAAELGIADHLKDSSLSAKALADKLSVHPQALYRLMRMLASHGVFTHQADDTFGLTSLSALLMSDHPESLRFLIMKEDESRWNAYSKLRYSVETGNPAFDQVHGIPYFDYIAQNPERSKSFDIGMANLSAAEDSAIAQSYDFSAYPTIADIGGGVGNLVCKIIKKTNHAHGILFELPHVMERAAHHIEQQGCTQQCSVIQGNFLEAVTVSADAIILKRILHDWNDQVSATILRNCKNALNPNGSIFVIDAVVPEGDSRDMSKDIDIMMMVLFGGQERNAKEFNELAHSVGLQIIKITPIENTMMSIIEMR